MPQIAEIAAEARRLVREAVKGSLATLDLPGGAPYASLITLATDASGAPTFLISTLARHTRNLVADPRASILIDGTGIGAGDNADPLQGARLTLSGRAEKTGDPAVRRRFLARQQAASFYADFPDFSFWRLELESAHLIGGFGKIVDLAASDLLVPLDSAETLIEAEPDIVEHMNDDHADAVALYADVLCGPADKDRDTSHEPAGWRVTGIDPEGYDLMRNAEGRRVTFAKRVLTPQDARKEFVRLAGDARAKLRA